MVGWHFRDSVTVKVSVITLLRFCWCPCYSTWSQTTTNMCCYFSHSQYLWVWESRTRKCHPVNITSNEPLVKILLPVLVPLGSVDIKLFAPMGGLLPPRYTSVLCPTWSCTSMNFSKRIIPNSLSAHRSPFLDSQLLELYYFLLVVSHICSTKIQ